MNKGKRKELIAKGSELEPTVHIGKEGLSEGVVEEVRAQVKRSRLVKVRVLPNADLTTDEVGSELAERSGTVVVDVRGFTVLLCDPRSAR
ncbi:MAG TPA: YhbY family RNA-binding protein [Methanomassiliicoccaceae archaeon]|jgi:RNA-binding protein|nr:YhbY family RNA-binding protein [Euryarchaeota archaeon]HOB38824.1 YhbY family RNA-binding protein [Methanomassiliicoccaceae archaeon]HOQ26491.1 YhbY family RNA-binding protein [Methanomassiliicoccaceae archaeon]HPT73633.1 YhbY family RNA-binding protein [Methanomassiliicoccaceae archaeon]HQA21286.1 YhbY family RNA-binding protein [Methanomassiliicoccaceae archaeon]